MQYSSIETVQFYAFLTNSLTNFKWFYDLRTNLSSSNSIKAKPGGCLATHTSFKGPNLLNSVSNSLLSVCLSTLPMYSLAMAARIVVS